MPRYKLTIEYDGTPFVGWQMQKEDASVQSCIAEAITAFSKEEVGVNGAGRTDAGVHATGQVAHIDLAKDWGANRVREAINYHIKPNPVSILQVEEVDENFDARFTATARHYLYRIINRRPRPTLDKKRVWHVPVDLDATAMHTAAQRLLGEHDFTTFRSAHCQAKSPVKTLDSISVIRAGEELRIETSARSFMHNQVRSMVGSLKMVGEGKWSADDLAAALKAADRSKCGPVAPAHGLYLVGVSY